MTIERFKHLLKDSAKNSMVQSFEVNSSLDYDYEIITDPDNFTTTRIVNVMLTDEENLFIFSRLGNSESFDNENDSTILSIEENFRFASIRRLSNGVVAIFSCSLEEVETRIFEIALLEVSILAEVAGSAYFN